MKTKLLSICSVLFLQALTFGQASSNPTTLPFYDGFNYTVGGNLIGQGNWTNATTGTVDETIITSPTWNYANLQTPTGNALNYIGSGSDPIRYFTDQTSGTVYYSFLVSINDTSSFASQTNDVGVQFISLGQQSSSTAANSNYAACVFVRKSAAGNLNFGYTLDSTTSNTQWSSTNLTLGATYFVVASFTFDSSAPTGKIWINPVVNGTEPAATISTGVFTNNRLNLDRVYIRQDSSSKTPDVTLDELRIGNTWNSVAPVATAGVASNELNKISLYPNPTKNTLNIDSKDLTIDTVSIFSIDGKEVLNVNKVQNTIDVSSLTAGIYVVKLTSNESVLTRKIIIE